MQLTTVFWPSRLQSQRIQQENRESPVVSYWPIRTSETKAWSLIKPRITIPEMQSCSKEAGSRLIKYRRRYGLCGSDLISQLYQRFHERRPRLWLCCLPLGALVWRFERNWCRVSDIATNKNCDFTSGYEQFARYNTLFYNPHSKHIKPNTTPIVMFASVISALVYWLTVRIHCVFR